MKRSRRKIEAPAAVYRAIVYLAPHGSWSWRILQGQDELMGGAGFQDWSRARAVCREFLDAYDAQAEVKVEFPLG